ncbi:hypothetical protein [Prescottella equi]|uniref:hypothetical protein n=1 Tax=Rhodococcus hoagii TaxID=43767 RepID=UPI001EEC5AA7|nr:hypothetical protein [Prescottella equi]
MLDEAHHVVNYPPPTFPGGVMLLVERPGVADRHGDMRDANNNLIDPNNLPTEPIGPCDLKWIDNGENNTDGEQRIHRAQITAPVDAVVAADDHIRFDGDRYSIEGDIERPRNGFTGWQSGVRFIIRRVK